MRMINELKIMNNMKTAKQWKRVPFDIELAKKIQAGEIEGKIKYTEDDSHMYNAEIIKFDLIADKSRAKPNSTLFRTIVAIVDFDNYQGVRTFNSAGYGCNYNGDDTRLLIEVPDYVSNEPQFKPFDKVLVKYDKEGAKWFPTILSQVINGLYINVADKVFKECILYEGNEHLVGTTNKPEED